MKKKIGIITLGCKVNQYESEAFAEALTDLGYEICDDGITVTAEWAPTPGVSYDGSSATLYYKKKNHVFREIGVAQRNIHHCNFPRSTVS